MPDQRDHKLDRLAVPHLRPGERSLAIARVVPARSARGAGGGVGLAAGIGNKISQAGAVAGGAGSMADSFPHHLSQLATQLLTVTDQRLLFLLGGRGRQDAELVWSAPRSAIAGVERRPRLQIMARFRLHFTDGSSVALLTTRGRTIDSLADNAVLGRWPVQATS